MRRVLAGCMNLAVLAPVLIPVGSSVDAQNHLVHNMQALPYPPIAGRDCSGSQHANSAWGGIPTKEASYHSLSDVLQEAANPRVEVPLGEPMIMEGGSVAGGSREHFSQWLVPGGVIRQSPSSNSVHSDG